jgi:two-component system NtrC family sensor kinase
VFEPFYTTKEAGHGNGLGLVVVKGIVEDHGGDIEVISEVDGGSEFVIRIPTENSRNGQSRH